MPSELVVLTPEKSVVTFRLAGAGTRIFAHCLDLFLFGALMYLVLSLSISLEIWVPELSNGLVMFLVSLGPFLYFPIVEVWMKGSSPGKKVAGLQVRMVDGTPATPTALILRNLLRAADFVPALYILGTVALSVTPRFQRIGDLVAGTVVVFLNRQPVPYSVAPHTAGIHPLEASVGELRNMRDDQYYVLRRFCDRWPTLPPHVAEELAETVARPILKRVGVRPRADIHPLYQAEAVVMKYGRIRGLL